MIVSHLFFIFNHILRNLNFIQCEISSCLLKLNKSFDEINRPSEPTVTVSLLDGSASFLDGLSRANMRFEQSQTGEFTVYGANQDIAASVWNIAQESGAAIQSLRPARNSLEKVFLTLIDAEEAHLGQARANSGVAKETSA